MTGREKLKKYFNIMPDSMYLRLRHLATQGRFPNLKNPKTFNEIILSHMLKEPTEFEINSADKVESRKFVHKIGLGCTLTKLIGVISTPEEVDSINLPDSFAAKASHCSGKVLIQIDKKYCYYEVKDQFLSWLKTDYSKIGREKIYKKMHKRIIIEELLRTADGEIPKDYKLYTFNGKCKIIHVDSNRFKKHTRNYYTPNWEHLNFSAQYPNGPIDLKPKNLGKMIFVAEKIGSYFQFARVDLYDLGEKVVFGEITHYPESGNVRFHPKDYDSYMGNFFSE